MKRVILFLLSCIGLFYGCTTTKDVSKTTHARDSLALVETRDSVRLLLSERMTLQQLLNELEFLTVEFDSTDCPDIKYPECPDMLNKDSINRLVSDLNMGIKGLNNKIKKLADGSVEITGRLKNASYKNEKQSQQIIDQRRIIDSFKTHSTKSTVEVKTETKYVEKHIKRKILHNWWVYLICIALGYFLCLRFGDPLGIKKLMSKI